MTATHYPQCSVLPSWVAGGVGIACGGHQHQHPPHPALPSCRKRDKPTRSEMREEIDALKVQAWEHVPASRPLSSCREHCPDGGAVLAPRPRSHSSQTPTDPAAPSRVPVCSSSSLTAGIQLHSSHGLPACTCGSGDNTALLTPWPAGATCVCARPVRASGPPPCLPELVSNSYKCPSSTQQAAGDRQGRAEHGSLSDTAKRISHNHSGSEAFREVEQKKPRQFKQP